MSSCGLAISVQAVGTFGAENILHDTLISGDIHRASTTLAHQATNSRGRKAIGRLCITIAVRATASHSHKVLAGIDYQLLHK